MRAGKLDKAITIQRFTSTVDAYGTVTENWTDLAPVKAQVIQSSTEEFMRAWGTSSEPVIVFRIRYREDITLADRIQHGDQHFDIKEIKDLGRRVGLELRCAGA